MEKPTVDDRTISFLKSSASLKQEANDLAYCELKNTNVELTKENREYWKVLKLVVYMR